MSPADQSTVDQFLAQLRRVAPAHGRSTFTYLAIREGSEYFIHRGRLNLGGLATLPSPEQFRSTSVRAGVCLLSQMNIDAAGLVVGLEGGTIVTPHGPLRFRKGPSQELSVSHVPIHRDGLASQRRYSVLTLIGGQMQELAPPNSPLDWELRSASPPFDGLIDLLSHFGLSVERNNVAYVEIAATPVVHVHTDAIGIFSGEVVTPSILLSRGLNMDSATLGYRIVSRDLQVKGRGIVLGAQLAWKPEGDFMRGTVSMKIPRGAALHCFASYEDVAYHHYWLVDPKHSLNPRDVAFMTYDAAREVITEYLTGKGKDSTGFESAISWLGWIHGFAVIHLAGKKIGDGPDLVAATPAGHFAVIEATTNIPTTSNKLAKVAARAQSMREHLAAAGIVGPRVIAILVSALPSSQMQADIAQARKLGVKVLCREELDRALGSASLPTNAERVYEQAFQEIDAGRSAP